MVENEKTIRKWWLYTFFLVIFVTMVNSFYAQIKNPSSIPENISYIAMVIGVTIFILVFFGFYLGLYFFSYVKRGTKLLTFFIWMFFIGLTFNVLTWGAYALGMIKEWNQPMRSTPGGLFLFILGYLVSALFCYLNIKLRQVNRAHKKGH